MKYAVGVDVGGTKIDAILYDGRRILREVVLKTKHNKKEFLKQLDSSINAVISGFNKKDMRGIGIGVPGILDEKKEKIARAPNLNGIENYPLKNFVEKRFGLKVMLDNDVKCMAMAENELENHNAKNMVVLAIGTGIGGGIIINGKIYEGRGNAPELGHITINEQGLKCSCGNYGCLEEYFSGRAIEREAKKANLEKTYPTDVENLARKGNIKAKEIYERLGKHLGTGISNMIKILDPELVVIGGGVSNASDLFLSSTLAEVKKRMHFAPCRIVVTNLKSAGAIGAALLVY